MRDINRSVLILLIILGFTSSDAQEFPVDDSIVALTSQICFCNDLSNRFIEEMHQWKMSANSYDHCVTGHADSQELKELFSNLVQSSLHSTNGSVQTDCKNLIKRIIDFNSCIANEGNYSIDLLTLYADYLVIYEIVGDNMLGLLEWNELEFYVTKLGNDFADINLGNRYEDISITLALRELEDCIDVLLDSFSFGDRKMLLDPCDILDEKFKNLICASSKTVKQI